MGGDDNRHGNMYSSILRFLGSIFSRFVTIAKFWTHRW